MELPGLNGLQIAGASLAAIGGSTWWVGHVNRRPSQNALAEVRELRALPNPTRVQIENVVELLWRERNTRAFARGAGVLAALAGAGLFAVASTRRSG